VLALTSDERATRNIDGDGRSGGAARAVFLREACGADVGLRHDVEALLDALPRADTQDLFPPLPAEPLRAFDSAARPSKPHPAMECAPSDAHGESVAVSELHPGDQVGRYRVVHHMGAGGMGTVYAAYDTALERRIALKFLSAVPGVPAAVGGLLAEASAMARLSHANVVAVYDVGMFRGNPFVAMEYVQGVTLQAWRRERPRSVRTVLTVMAGVARGLAAVHAAGIVHGDVKPDNVLVDGVRVLVTDFGLSVRDGTTDGRSVAGTPGYMAPEQLLGEPATRATDIFGFCATLFEMLHLRPPFGTGSVAEIQSRMGAGQPASRSGDRRLPPRIQRLLRSGLALDPSARPVGMEVIARILLADPVRIARRMWWIGVGAAMAMAAVWVGHRLQTGPVSGPQVVAGPAWVQPARPVPTTMFGVTMHSSTGAMPSFQVGAVRFWDSGTRWAGIQPRSGAFVWDTLDRLVDAARRAKLPVLFTIGATPAWAAPAGPRGPYDDGSRTAPPDRMADWEDFVAALVERYGDRIEAYEVWVLGNDARFYTGSVEKLVEMTRIAYRTIKRVAPGALVVCPGMGRLSTADGQQFLRRFAELDGYQHCDVASIKLYQRSPSDPPESMLELVQAVDRILHAAGVHPPVWNTGTTYEIAVQEPLGESRAISHAVRFFLVGLYARLGRMYLYNWGGTKLPIVLQPEGGWPTTAALAVQELQRWLQHARIRSCGEGPAIGLPKGVWQCEFTIATGNRTFDAAIRWSHHGSRATIAAPTSVAVHRLDGTTTAIIAGETLVVGEQPIFIEYARTTSD
jgi:predicted Ser/Thr protein kinase